MKRVIELIQGTEAWHAHRAHSLNASDAPKMLGISKKRTRSSLLKEKVTGVAEEVSDFVEKKLFVDGHRNEAIARAWAEEIVGQELFPEIQALDVEELPLSASFDGITMCNTITWEHKSLNQELAELVPAGVIPEEYHPQMEQGLMISGASKCLFMASSDGNRETMVHAWYYPNSAMRSRLIAGWKQFLEDMKTWQPPAVKEVLVAETQELLPAINLRVEARVMASNLDMVRSRAKEVFSGINTNPQTVQELVDGEANIKFCKETEKRIGLAKEQMIAQASDFAAAMQILDEMMEEARNTRLPLEKNLKANKDRIRVTMVQKAQSELNEFIARFNAEFGRPCINYRAGFELAIKGKKSEKTCEEAIETALANAKIDVTEQAAVIRSNLASVRDEHWGLLPDFAAIGSLPNDQFATLLAGRIAEDIQRKQETEKRQAEAQKSVATPEPQKPVPAPESQKAQEPVAAANDLVMPAVSKNDVDAFISINSFGKNEERIRQILTEFVSFQKSRQMQKAA